MIGQFPDGQVPESSLGNALTNMTEQWNSLLSQVITEVDHTQPIPEHIKETAEFAVKQVSLLWEENTKFLTFSFETHAWR